MYIQLRSEENLLKLRFGLIQLIRSTSPMQVRGLIQQTIRTRKILEGGITLRWVYRQKFRPVSCPSREV